MANKVKYPPKYVNRELKRMLGTLKHNKDCIFVGSLFRDKPYSKKTMDVVVKRFIDKVKNKKITKEDSDYTYIKSIVTVKSKMAEIIEANVVDTPNIKIAFKKYLLSCCHKWIEEEKRLGLKVNIKQETSYTINLPQQLDAKQLGDKVIEIGVDGRIKQ